MWKNPVWPSGFFEAMTPALKGDSEAEKELVRGEESESESGNESSSELTVSWEYPSMSRRPRIADPGKQFLSERETVNSVDELTVSWDHLTRFKKPRIGNDICSTADKPPFAYHLVAPNPVAKVSTKLTLFDESWFTKTSNCDSNIRGNKALEELFDNRMPKVVASSQNVSADPWKIKKKLCDSDISRRRIVVRLNLIKNYILPFLSEDTVDLVESTGSQLNVWDLDTKTSHKCVLKRWSASTNRKSYVLTGGWKHGFQERRNLKEGDEVGFYWDMQNSRLNFGVLNRAFIS